MVSVLTLMPPSQAMHYGKCTYPNAWPGKEALG